jgi:hypothetical protein
MQFSPTSRLFDPNILGCHQPIFFPKCDRPIKKREEAESCKQGVGEEELTWCMNRIPSVRALVLLQDTRGHALNNSSSEKQVGVR